MTPFPAYKPETTLARAVSPLVLQLSPKHASIQLCAAKLPLRTSNSRQTKLARRRVHISTGRRLQINCAISGRSDRELGSNNDGFEEKPFWSTLFKEAVGGLKSLLAFLVEQPGQLKYIEWPSFQSTLRTAALTLVLVAILIVALSSIDSALSYVLALLLRRTA
ncbi:hypothetical protein ACLOJK_025561 [Asimina triloba]